MVALVERRKEFSNDSVFPEELKHVQEGKIVDGGTNDTTTTLTGVRTQRVQISFF